MSGEGGLSQEEIDALLASAAAGGVPGAGPGAEAGADPDASAAALTPDESDAVGEIGNICMSSAATVLSMLLNQQVTITTPTVELVSVESLKADLDHRPATSVRVEYTEGVDGATVFLLPAGDAAVVADLMMGGPGTDAGEDLDEMHLSAVSEAMNQMMGNASTALAQMIGRRIDISAPDVALLDLDQEEIDLGVPAGHDMVRVRFDLAVGDLLHSKLMQLMPVDFARTLAQGLLGTGFAGEPEALAPPEVGPPPSLEPAPLADALAATAATLAPDPPAIPELEAVALPPPAPSAAPAGPPPMVQPVAFPSLADGPTLPGGTDITMLLDVPLRVTVELGRTRMKIRDVLSLVPGSIVELEKLAGEPVDILVNGKEIARGEVVVIDEEFGVRITDIASRAKRLKKLGTEVA
ncbi:MAG: flagellar motor switch phosphatase FliY [Thermoleophilia bacterium]|nr:flagellar motor switch phosphatase FliY [Thermoleophilia bacterium]